MRFRIVLRRPHHGYSLIELLAVMLIISILMGIAIPTYLGQRRTAQDRDAQASLRNTLVSARSVAAISGSKYPSAAALRGRLDTDSGAISFVEGVVASSGPKVVSVHRPGNRELYLAVLSESGSCWFAYDNLGKGSRFGVVRYDVFENPSNTLDPAVDCKADHENLTPADFADAPETPAEDGTSFTDVAEVDLES